MTAESWSPPGVDIEALKAEEFELTRRLNIVRGILRAASVGVAVRSEALPAEKTAAPPPPDIFTLAPRPTEKGRGKKQRAVLDIVRTAGGRVHHSIIHSHMQARFPGLMWKSSAETVRAYAREMPGRLVSLGGGYWGVSDEDKGEGS